MKRDIIIVALLWLVLTVVGEYVAATVRLYPAPTADKGDEIDHAFRVLIYMAVPVFTFVIAVLAYSVGKRGTFAYPGEDGPPIHGRGAAPVSWLAITSGLTLVLMIYPGLLGVNELFFKDEPTDLVVEVQGVQWAWIFHYPEENVDAVGEMALPVDRNVRFRVTSTDVVHSFWIPAFLMKIDAVPGQTTEFQVKPTEIGSFETSKLMRVQCAELCGLQHSKMSATLSVLSEDDYDAWIKDHEAPPATATPTPAAGAQQVTIVGKDLKFDLDTITVEAGRQVDVTFDNQDEGIPHNWALYQDEAAATGGADPIAGSEIANGIIEQHIVFDPPDPGTYFYRCDVHPTTMTGEFIVQ